ncbi:C1 family peptidase, partial [Limnofasciculus baicalensis]
MKSEDKKVVLINQNTGKRIKLGGFHKSDQKPPNSKQYAASRYQKKDLPHKVDLRPYMTKVENQANANSCTANAMVGAYEYLAKRMLGDSGDVSRLFVYYNARALDGKRVKDEGTSLTNCIQVLQDMGACTEDTWPYETSQVNKQPSDEAYEEAEQFLIEDAEEIDIDLFSMKHCLAEGYPFAFGMLLFKSFDKATKKGRVPMPDLSTEEGRETHGAHAMLCVGYSDKNEAFIVRNSWGDDWGDNGYCYIPYDYLTNPDLSWDCWTIRKVTDLDFSRDISSDDEEYFYAADEEDYDDSDSYYEEADEEDYDDDD